MAVQLTERMSEILPPSWTCSVTAQPQGSERRSDLLLEFISPRSNKGIVEIEIKSLLEKRDIPRLGAWAQNGRTSRNPVNRAIYCRYLSPEIRSELQRAQVSYIDMTGNIRMVLESPEIFIVNTGATKDPWRKPGRPLGSLRGGPAAKVVRALIDNAGPWRVRELIEASDSATGSVYRVLDYLEREDLIEKTDSGNFQLKNIERLLQDWSNGYEILTTNKTSTWIAPRGIEDLIAQLRNTDREDYVVTGSIAASTWAPSAPVRLAMVYSPNSLMLAERLGLRPAEAGANVILVEPAFEVLTRGATRRSDGLMVAAAGQVAVDLMGSPGRGPSEASALVDWMIHNESQWRKS